MPVHLCRHLRNDERIKCYGFLKEVCYQSTTSSYRIACGNINRQFHREFDQSELPLMTFTSIVISEGNRIRKAINQKTNDVLCQFGFNEDGSWPEKKLFPMEIQNHLLECCLISPMAIMREHNLEMPSSIMYPEGEYSKPEEGLHPRKKSRRTARTMYSDDDRPGVLKDYVAYINSMNDRDPFQMIRHPDAVEKKTDHIVNIFVDGDLVNKQAETRVTGGKTESKEEKEYIKHIDIRVETDDGGRYNITSPDIDNAFRQLLAFLLDTKLINRFLQFFVDGEKLLKSNIDNYFQYWHHRTFLDEYHIDEKIDVLISLGIKARRVPCPWEEPTLYVRGPKEGSIRHQPMTSLSRVYASRIKTAIHYGNVDEAIDYIKHIDPNDIDKPEALKSLIEYIEHRREMIPCYALRKKAGLKNSSNSSELCNELIISERQKVDDKMHWGEDGSAALAALTAIFVNDADDLWFRKRQIKFEPYYVEPTKVYQISKKRLA